MAVSPAITSGSRTLFSEDLLTERDLVSHTFDGHVYYVPVSGRTKAPKVKLSTCREATIPETGCYGMIPRGRLVILDLDHPKKGKGLSPDQQLELLFDDYGLPRNVRTHRSLSGGIHVFAFWPQKSDLPRNWKLSKIDPRLNGDIRSSKNLGYVLGPGSQVNGAKYRILNDVPLIEYPSGFAEKFLKNGVDSFDSKVKTNDFSPHPFEGLPGKTMSTDDLDRLSVYLSRAPKNRFHEKRASVFRQISCCCTAEEMLRVWSFLEIDRDSYRRSRISKKALIADFNGLKKRLGRSRTHSGYCPSSQNFRASKTKTEDATTKKSSEEYAVDYSRRLLERLKRPSEWRSFKVLDLVKVSHVLDVRGGRRSDDTELAFAVLEYVVQPWLNFGVSGVLLGDEFLTDLFGVSKARVKNAKKLLLRREVLFVKHRQGPGRTTVFGVRQNFVDEHLSRRLQSLVIGENRTLEVDLRSSHFRDPKTGEVVAEFVPDLREWREKAFFRMPKMIPGANLHDLLTGRVKLGQLVEPTSERPQIEAARVHSNHYGLSPYTSPWAYSDDELRQHEEKMLNKVDASRGCSSRRASRDRYIRSLRLQQSLLRDLTVIQHGRPNRPSKTKKKFGRKTIAPKTSVQIPLKIVTKRYRSERDRSLPDELTSWWVPESPYDDAKYSRLTMKQERVLRARLELSKKIDPFMSEEDRFSKHLKFTQAKLSRILSRSKNSELSGKILDSATSVIRSGGSPLDLVKAVCSVEGVDLSSPEVLAKYLDLSIFTERELLSICGSWSSLSRNDRRSMLLRARFQYIYDVATYARSEVTLEEIIRNVETLRELSFGVVHLGRSYDGLPHDLFTFTSTKAEEQFTRLYYASKGRSRRWILDAIADKSVSCFMSYQSWVEFSARRRAAISSTKGWSYESERFLVATLVEDLHLIDEYSLPYSQSEFEKVNQHFVEIRRYVI